MKTILLNDKNYNSELQTLCKRPACPAHIEAAVADIVQQVKERGDAAVCEFVKRFDGVEMTPERYLVTPAEIEEAKKLVTASQKQAIKLALKNIRTFAKMTIPKSWKKQVRPGVTLGEMYQPMERAACYIPGGTAPLVSTAVHTVGIAKAAGVISTPSKRLTNSQTAASPRSLTC